MLEFQSLESLTSAFARRGCSTVFVKALAATHDNSKHQVVLGTSTALARALPGRLVAGAPTSSVKKTSNTTGHTRLVQELDFHWITGAGEQAKAPESKLIFYPQYPELRLSGFLAHCSLGPDSLRPEHLSRFGQRYLVLGSNSREVFATVVTTKNSPNLARQLGSLPLRGQSSILRVLPITGSSAPSTNELDEVLGALSGLVGRKHESQRRTDSGVMSFTGSQGGGYTLESLLGISTNSVAGPDLQGFELKTFSGGRITLMTPEPDLGFRYSAGFKDFMMRYGRTEPNKRNCRLFNGAHFAGERNTKTGLRLMIDSWNCRTHRPEGELTPQVMLRTWRRPYVDVAGWSAEKLEKSWMGKHASAIYVPTSQTVESNGKVYYEFGPVAHVATGTSYHRLLTAVSKRIVAYDPGDALRYGKEKRRSQWRLAGPASALPEAFAELYDSYRQVEL